MIAKQLITGTITPLKPDDSGDFALGLMEEMHLMHLPVVQDVVCTGVISETDLLGMSDPGDSVGEQQVPVKPVFAAEGIHLLDVIRIMNAHQLTILPVVNDKRHYLGSVTLASLVKQMSDLAAVESPGGIIVLEINDKDYLLTEIAQIVESNDAKVLSMYITSFPDSTKIEVTLKINRIDIGPVLQTFFRYNYIVKASWSDEDAYNESLQNRYDSLMNYLNI
jgi:CBS domain-containing protein